MNSIAPNVDVQQRALRDLYREQAADRLTCFRQKDGSLRLTMWRHDDRTPVCTALITPTGQTLVDVTEAIA